LLRQGLREQDISAERRLDLVFLRQLCFSAYCESPPVLLRVCFKTEAYL